MSSCPPLVVILGPTGSGKSALAIKLARRFLGEIVNADSRTVYQDMTIGTACPSLVNSVPYHLFQMVRPDASFTLHDYKQRAVQTIFDIHRRGKLPFLVGGTGLYIKTIVDNLEIPRVPPDKEIREKLAQELTEKGLSFLWQRLTNLDPRAKHIVQKDNPRRVIRALEIILATKKPFSQLRRKGAPFFHALQLGILLPRKELYRRIDQRTDEMFASGLVDEVKMLVKKYGVHCTPLHGLIYQQVVDYLDKKISLPETIQRAKFAQHAFARRQITWFKKDTRIQWITNESKAQILIERFIKQRY